jgi:hypothetical protein
VRSKASPSAAKPCAASCARPVWAECALNPSGVCEPVRWGVLVVCCVAQISPRKRRAPAHQRRLRSARVGELVQLDGSP